MLKFTYEKSNGEVSSRVGIVVYTANKNSGILDLSDLSSEEQKQIAELYSAWEAKHKALQEEMGITTLYKKYFKHFKPEGISDAVSI